MKSRPTISLLLSSMLLAFGCVRPGFKQAPPRATSSAPPLPTNPHFLAPRVPAPEVIAKVATVPSLQWTNQGSAIVLASSNLLDWVAVTNTTAGAYRVSEPSPSFYRIQAEESFVTVAWNKSDPFAIAYRVYWGTASRSYSSLLLTTATIATVSKLSPGVNYFLAVTALNGTGLESDFSNEIQYTPPPSFFPVLISQ